MSLLLDATPKRRYGTAMEADTAAKLKSLNITVNSTDVVGYVLAATPSRTETSELIGRALDEISVQVS